MSRYSRINTIWRKELIDTLRDRRTVIAMVLVPMILYPALMLGSLQAFEVQVANLVTEQYDLAVASKEVGDWLRRLLDADAFRPEQDHDATAEALVEESRAEPQPGADGEKPSLQKSGAQAAKMGVYEHPPEYRIWVVPDVAAAITAGDMHAGVLVEGQPPLPGVAGSTRVVVAFDESDIRSEIAAAGVQGVLDRANLRMLLQRLKDKNLGTDFVRPIALDEWNVASPERMAGAILGTIVPLILIVMTITGAIYPAIDLTAGERERGTLETLMVAPVPTVDLIAGKFVVVTLIGLMSAVLNLLSVGGTIYFAGLGSMLTRGSEFVFPLSALPWILLLLIPLAVMFSALLLAVCSFARSFKEAQNYIVPVMLAGMIPGVVGILPGTRLEGPIVIMPVANIVVLTRELFLGRFDYFAIFLVVLSTSLYAGAAVAVAAKLFGQEAVLFADSGSVKTIFQRRHFKPRPVPTAAQALLVITLAYSLNFYIQQAITKSGLSEGLRYLNAVALTIIVVFAIGPWFAARYMRVNVTSAFRLGTPDPRGVLAALCFGCSTWILALRWGEIQQRLLPMDSNVARMLEQQFAWLMDINPLVLVFFLAVVPALCEELFFRGYALSGLRASLGKSGAVVVVAIAFGMTHYSAQRLVTTTALGLLLGLLVVQYRSIWPAMIAHFMHNAISVTASHPDGLKPWLVSLGYPEAADASVPGTWVLAASVLVAVGVLICLVSPRREQTRKALEPQMQPGG
jgi:sodium transport system permease protein